MKSDVINAHEAALVALDLAFDALAAYLRDSRGHEYTRRVLKNVVANHYGSDRFDPIANVLVGTMLTRQKQIGHFDYLDLVKKIGEPLGLSTRSQQELVAAQLCGVAISSSEVSLPHLHGVREAVRRSVTLRADGALAVIDTELDRSAAQFYRFNLSGLLDGLAVTTKLTFLGNPTGSELQTLKAALNAGGFQFINVAAAFKLDNANAAQSQFVVLGQEPDEAYLFKVEAGEYSIQRLPASCVKVLENISDESDFRFSVSDYQKEGVVTTDLITHVAPQLMITVQPGDRVVFNPMLDESGKKAVNPLTYYGIPLDVAILQQGLNEKAQEYIKGKVCHGEKAAVAITEARDWLESTADELTAKFSPNNPRYQEM
jgi:hypothetical protein